MFEQYVQIWNKCDAQAWLLEKDLKRAWFISDSVAYTDTFKAHFHKWNKRDMQFHLNKLISNKLGQEAKCIKQTKSKSWKYV